MAPTMWPVGPRPRLPAVHARLRPGRYAGWVFRQTRWLVVRSYSRWVMTPRSAVLVGAWARRPAVRDAVLALALLVACVQVNGPNALVDGTADPFGDGPTDPAALWWGATVLAVAAVALRRRWPAPMFVVAVLSVATHVAQNAPLTLIDLSAPILLFTVATVTAGGLADRAGRPARGPQGWSWFAAQDTPAPALRPVQDDGRPVVTGPMGEALPRPPEPGRPFVVLRTSARTSGTACRGSPRR